MWQVNDKVNHRFCSGGLTRLEMNKGGLGKNPYAGILGMSNTANGLVPGMRSMQVRAKFGQLGQAEGQFNSPHGFCLGRNEDIVVADTHNHRIQVYHFMHCATPKAK